jgi:hypothetical protein
MIIGACDCPFCGPHALTTPSTNNNTVLPCSWRLEASIIDGASEGFLIARHSTSHLSESFLKYTFATRFQRHVSRETGGRLTPLCPFLSAWRFPITTTAPIQPFLIHHHQLQLYLIIKIQYARQTGLAGTVHLGVFSFVFYSSSFFTRVSCFGFSAFALPLEKEACLRYPFFFFYYSLSAIP